MDGQKFTIGQSFALLLLHLSIFVAIVLGSARLFPHAHAIVFYVLGLMVLSRYVAKGVEATVGKWLVGDKNNSQTGDQQ